MSIEYLSKSDLLYLVTKIKSALDKGYIVKDGSKILSTNDFTDEYKSKLDGIAAQATKVIVDSALTASGTNPVQGKVIYTAINNVLKNAALTGTPTAPTASTGTSTTQIATTAFVQAAVAAAIGSVAGVRFDKVNSLPSTGKTGVIYLIAKANGSEKDNYDEYYWTGSSFEYMGTTEVDLTGYVRTSDLAEVSTADIDSIFATVFG